ncbi:hypothetical protein SISNIDRAFT_497978 [Sistotremastrum niveocremeum HHB9708]|uniref:Uncharacterized protein n=2 Tax=Sistotremastraceae TaxID=3402574 RepID=A0A164P4W2_9AGAM|nr:hypothetical protein SISNIDRAFT_497978 [Sistotremastrum niveocremeum HHB9708]KZT39717.1 hypothetical protein SISSUDRAFT_1045223 [Sistotremastrum suecicum HHB10207 ss-3]
MFDESSCFCGRPLTTSGPYCSAACAAQDSKSSSPSHSPYRPSPSPAYRPNDLPELIHSRATGRHSLSSSTDSDEDGYPVDRSASRHRLEAHSNGSYGLQYSRRPSATNRNSLIPVTMPHVHRRTSSTSSGNPDMARSISGRTHSDDLFALKSQTRLLPHSNSALSVTSSSSSSDNEDYPRVGYPSSAPLSSRLLNRVHPEYSQSTVKAPVDTKATMRSRNRASLPAQFSRLQVDVHANGQSPKDYDGEVETPLGRRAGNRDASTEVYGYSATSTTPGRGDSKRSIRTGRSRSPRPSEGQVPTDGIYPPRGRPMARLPKSRTAPLPAGYGHDSSASPPPGVTVPPSSWSSKKAFGLGYERGLGERAVRDEAVVETRGRQGRVSEEERADDEGRERGRSRVVVKRSGTVAVR